MGHVNRIPRFSRRALENLTDEIVLFLEAQQEGYAAFTKTSNLYHWLEYFGFDMTKVHHIPSNIFSRCCFKIKIDQEGYAIDLEECGDEIDEFIKLMRL